MCKPYDIVNYDLVSQQPPDHTAATRSRGKKRITRDKSGTKRDLQEPNGDPGYGVIVHLSISAISQMILARFGSNFKQRVLGTYTTDYNCHHDICPGNICPGDICPYQQYMHFQAEHFRLQSCFFKNWEYTNNFQTLNLRDRQINRPRY